MCSSINMVPSGLSVLNSETRTNLGFLCIHINRIFNATDKTLQIIELAKKLVAFKKKDIQSTEHSLCNEYPNIDKKIHIEFAKILHKFSGNPIQEGLEYVQNAPGYHPKTGFRVPRNWRKDKTVALHQIYKEQFFVWMLSNSHSPFGVILSMLKILQSFDNPSIQLDERIWKKLYSQTEEKHRKQLKEFQCKYEFLRGNKFLQVFPIELQNIAIVPDLQIHVHSQYRLWSKAFQWMLLQMTNNDAPRMSDQHALEESQNAWEQLSKAVLAHRLKKTLPISHEKVLAFIEYLNQPGRTQEEKKRDEAQLRESSESQAEIRNILSICQRKKEQLTDQVKSERQKKLGVQRIMNNLMTEYKKLESDGIGKLERDSQFNQRLHDILEEKITALSHVEEVEDFFRNQYQIFEKLKLDIQSRICTDLLYLLKEEFQLISFLISQINRSATTEQTWSKEGKEGLSIDEFDEMLETFEPQRKHSSARVFKKHQLQRRNSLDPVEEAFNRPVTPNTPPEHARAEKSDSLFMNRVQIYLSDPGKNKELNGCLSQAVEGCLQPLRPCLYRSQQGKEAYDHLLLGIAALEHMEQAIHEGRKNHAILGFRSALIHCNLVVEQALCHGIVQKTGVYVNSHNLIYLAERLEECTEKSILKKSKSFLEEIKVHLFFRYPEDYRLYFAHNGSIPKAFFLLDALSQPEIRRENIQEVISFSFEKYCQTLEFISALLEDAMQSGLDFTQHMNAVQQQLHEALDTANNKNNSTSSLIKEKVETAEKILHALNGLVHIKDFEEGRLLAIFNNMKHYLQLMKVAVDAPQITSEHSLQRFIRVETLLNMDKLFKHLFRAVSILRLGKDNHAHDLKEFFPLIGALSERDKALLKKINIAIAHHYLHKSSNVELKKEYEDFLEQSCALLLTEPEFHVIGKNRQEFSYQTLRETEDKIISIVDNSLDLLIKLLKPVAQELKKMNNDIEEEIQNNQRIAL